MDLEDRRKDRSTAHVGPGEGRAVRTPWAGLITRKVRSEQTGGAYSLFEVEVGPAGGEPPHIQHREDECLYVLEGRFEFVDEVNELLVEEGAAIYVPKGTLHGFKNVGEGPGRLLAIHTPGNSRESFVEEAASASGPVDMAAGIAAKYGIEICSAEEQKTGAQPRSRKEPVHRGDPADTSGRDKRPGGGGIFFPYRAAPPPDSIEL